MTQFKVGDRVLREGEPGTIAGVWGDEHPAWEWATPDEEYLVRLDSEKGIDVHYAMPETLTPEPKVEDVINHPNHYNGFSNDAEVIDISENLTANAAQALQYIARSSRIDGNNKGDTLEDLHKAQWFLTREIARLESL